MDIIWNLVFHFTIAILRVLHYLSIWTVSDHNFYGPDRLSHFHTQQSATVYTVHRLIPPFGRQGTLEIPWFLAYIFYQNHVKWGILSNTCLYKEERFLSINIANHMCTPKYSCTTFLERMYNFFITLFSIKKYNYTNSMQCHITFTVSLRTKKQFTMLHLNHVLWLHECPDAASRPPA